MVCDVRKFDAELRCEAERKFPVPASEYMKKSRVCDFADEFASLQVLLKQLRSFLKWTVLSGLSSKGSRSGQQEEHRHKCMQTLHMKHLRRQPHEPSPSFILIVMIVGIVMSVG